MKIDCVEFRKIPDTDLVKIIIYRGLVFDHSYIRGTNIVSKLTDIILDMTEAGKIKAKFNGFAKDERSAIIINIWR